MGSYGIRAIGRSPLENPRGYFRLRTLGLLPLVLLPPRLTECPLPLLVPPSRAAPSITLVE